MANENTFELTELYSGNLGFSLDNPIESVVYYETEDIQKIYWVDGLHVLRFMNFMADSQERSSWLSMSNPFDTNREVGFGATATITKDNSGNNRPNGVVQYFLTYFNKHGQETGFAWASDLVYLSPAGIGGAADGTNINRITITLKGLDPSYSYFRVYSVFRSSLNGETVTYLVSEQKTPNNSSTEAVVTDDGAHLTLQETTRLLYLGSKAVIAGTIEHKDQTLFLGDLQSIGRSDYSDLEDTLHRYMFEGGGSFTDGTTCWSSRIQFVYSNNSSAGTNIQEAGDIAYVQNAGLYPYKNQLECTSSEILTFKSNEKYRFALRFQMQDGTLTDAFWIGDVINTLYPRIDDTTGKIKRVVAKCTIPSEVVQFLRANGFKTVQLMIAEASEADRAVKAQGFITPTMFNVWERYNKRVYAIPSWIARPRGSAYPCRHFDVVDKCTRTTSEIQCSYWRSDDIMTPYFRYENPASTSIKYSETYEEPQDFSHLMIIYNTSHYNSVIGRHYYTGYVTIIEAGGITPTDGNVEHDVPADTAEQLAAEIDGLRITQDMWQQGEEAEDAKYVYYYAKRADGSVKYWLRMTMFQGTGSNIGAHSPAIHEAYSKIREKFADLNLMDVVIDYSTFSNLCSNGSGYYNAFYSTNTSFAFEYDFDGTIGAVNAGGQDSRRWKTVGELTALKSVGNMTPAYYRKNLMFVDENIVTLNSPELAYNIAAFDQSDYNFRIVGAAKMTSIMSDFTVDATTGKLPGINLDGTSFNGTVEDNSRLMGLLSWPLWREYIVDDRPLKEGEKAKDYNKKTNSDYQWGSRIVHYWLYLWQHLGSIAEFRGDSDETEYSSLKKKTFANLHFSYETLYLNSPVEVEHEQNAIRIVNELANTFTHIVVNGETKYYTGAPQISLSMPGTLKYPIAYSSSFKEGASGIVDTDEPHVYTNSPVFVEFMTQSHAVISLPTNKSGSVYTQTILPHFFSSESIPDITSSGTLSAALLPWLEENDITSTSGSRSFVRYSTRSSLMSPPDGLSQNDQYVLIGEIYQTYSNSNDTRYGGIHLSDVSANRFVVAGPQYQVDHMSPSRGGVIIGNQGDTYFQRWDSMHVKPYSSSAPNGVIDVVSVMLETHINLDGRTDRQRGGTLLASTSIEDFGSLNTVYSQKNNFMVSRDLDEDFNTDAYRSSLTWTMPKQDMAAVDEWTHITLASSLKLDADKGICRAIRRYNNTLLAFQDRGISEILFNSRVQLSTKDGVPIEVANSGKVDGKRYITNNYGCTNKWSIVEGKRALYFVDNINKIFCSFSGNGIDNLSSRLGFDVWFRSINNLEPWRPKDYNNIVSYYDRIHDDVYLVKSANNTEPSLVFNEKLSQFTSFFDYGSVPMMTNVCDKYVSFKRESLWLQNEGKYCDFFGDERPFWVTYRVSPSPQTDKIWTNVDLRADFYNMFDINGNQIKENSLIDGGESLTEGLTVPGTYLPEEHFTSMTIWNEYQNTSVVAPSDTPTKKFRIWRYIIPRAVKTESNVNSFDRIRNPWIFMKLVKNVESENFGDNMLQLHDVEVKYYE